MRSAIIWVTLGLSFLIGFCGSGLVPWPVVMGLIALHVAVAFAGHISGIYSFYKPGGIAKMMGSFCVGAVIGVVVVLSR